MRTVKRSFLTFVAPVAIVIAGCGGSSSPSIPSSGQHHSVPGSNVGEVVLSQLGAQRIGVQTRPTRAVAAPRPAGKATVIVPYSALVYDPSGQTYAFANTASLTYVEVPVTVDHISGNSAYLVKGPTPGSRVVSVGAEELYGVQTGVLSQT